MNSLLKPQLALPAHLGGRSRRRLAPVAATQENLISDEKRNSALEFQLRRSSGRQPQASESEIPAQSSTAGEQADLAERKLAARAWISPWLDVRTKGESTKILREMQKRVAMMDDGRAENAMSRQLNQGRFLSKVPDVRLLQEEIVAQPESPTEVHISDQENSQYAPSRTFEDGSLLYSSSTLEATAAPDT